MVSSDQNFTRGLALSESDKAYHATWDGKLLNTTKNKPKDLQVSYNNNLSPVIVTI